MIPHARVVVIGGGVIGCSVLYHLTRMGWTDVVLLERRELTCGSSWHAAGQIHTINSNANLSSLQMHTLSFYPELEIESEQPLGLHRTGVLYLASTEERFNYLKQERAKARHLGSDMEFVDLAEVVRMHPLIETKHYLGALFDPLDGRIDPASVVHAYAKAARKRGGTIYLQTMVNGLRHRPDQTWDVITEKGEIHAEFVVNAAGLWGRDVGRMVGLEHPIQAMAHQYLITEPIQELIDLDHEAPGAIDYEANVYTRQEGQGLLLGTYEERGIPWSIDSTPWDFGHELLPDNLDQITDRLEVAFERFPILQTAGIKSVIHGPFCFAPDGNPVVGPVPGLQNYFAAVGSMAGFCQGAGIGKCLAEWIIEGEPEIDVFAMDVARFGDFATREYTLQKVIENFGRRFMITYPNEELPVMRPWRTTALYERLKEKGAVFGSSFGLEHVLWYAPHNVEPYEVPTFKRSNAFEHVAAECRGVRDGVGIIELANYAKYEVSGADAAIWLDGILAGRLPTVGRINLTPMLSPKGKLLGDFTVARLSAERFMIIGSGIAQSAHMRWFLQHLPVSGVELHNRSSELHGIGIAGPKSRELLSRLTRADVSSEAFKFRDCRELEIKGVSAFVVRISFTGELGYEIYCAPEYQLALYDSILAVAADLGLMHFGARALMSMRLEKNFGVWTLDYRPDFTPGEARLDRFVGYGKETAFIGKQAASAERNSGSERRLSAFVVDSADVDCTGDEPILHGGKCVGFTTSGGYGHYTETSIAMGYIPNNLTETDNDFEIEILGKMRPARLALKAAYDPNGNRMRG